MRMENPPVSDDIIDRPRDPLAIALGDRLRIVRNAQRLSLHDVEIKSDGRLSAVAVGSYERADRGVSVLKLYELAALYGVPVTALLPEGADDTDELDLLALEVTTVIEQRTQQIVARRGAADLKRSLRKRDADRGRRVEGSAELSHQN
jgi:transcriptional regulator with XRE-family HTH domain